MVAWWVVAREDSSRHSLRYDSRWRGVGVGLVNLAWDCRSNSSSSKRKWQRNVAWSLLGFCLLVLSPLPLFPPLPPLFPHPRSYSGRLRLKLGCDRGVGSLVLAGRTSGLPPNANIKTFPPPPFTLWTSIVSLPRLLPRPCSGGMKSLPIVAPVPSHSRSYFRPIRSVNTGRTSLD